MNQDSVNLVSKKIQGNGYLIVVSTPKGGAGKTTLATNITANLVMNGFSVQFIDIDKQQNGATVCNSMLANYMQEGYGRLKVKGMPILDSDLATSKMSMNLLKSIRSPSSSFKKGDDLIETRVPLELLAELPYLKQESDFVIIDTPGISNPFITQLIVASNLTLVPVQPSGFDYQTLNLLVNDLVVTGRALGADVSKLPIISILNNVKGAKCSIADVMRNALNESGLPCANSQIPSRKHYATITLPTSASNAKPYYIGPKARTEKIILEQDNLLKEIFYYLEHGSLPQSCNTSNQEDCVEND